MKRFRVLAIAIATSLPIGAVAQARPDTQRAENLFRAKCAACHSVGCNRTGPKLEGVFGRKAGTVQDYGGYSTALRESGLVWNEGTLDEFLRDGAKLVPGNSMSGGLAPIADPRERKLLIEHLRRQDRRIDLC
jgi:cytochrome c